MTLLTQWTFFRDAQVFLFTLHILHVLANARMSSNHWLSQCVIYETSSIITMSAALFLSFISILQGSKGIWSMVLDCLVLPLGIVLQMISKPDDWFGSAFWRVGCDLTASSFAEIVFLTGEAMTFTLIPRAILWMFEIQGRWTRTFFFVVGIGATAGLVYGIYSLTNPLE